VASAKKFGAFSGVFTPSILTILGVIMYLRLPWIIGQAGLYITLGIISVAHLISITTGLSIASIATDKKVKAGGNYYIISRSLGLPIGGTLGIALFVGLSFSVSLYIIGFSESFLSFWGIEATKSAIRLYGSITLIFITIVTFISTSLVIRMQYFILTAIALSLISIFFGNSNFTPATPHLMPSAQTVSLLVLFGVFFPAVTGFEAGVSMSGDLHDPKKSIPFGTISAIVVGYVVYVGLATFLSFRVGAENLINNSNILLDLSFFAPLVLAGIWGATISSAFGSILGAPRILQATAKDKITPKFFAKGYGITNEPRNALLLTFILAEAGILIGELNLIARLVSMFFITTYGVLNFSCALEKWASPDFRPSFKVSSWVSIFGAFASFFIMFQLDLIAFIGGLVILGSLFVYLKHKELALKSGDTWEGVWVSVVRSTLSRLNSKIVHERNWRPNIILFKRSTETKDNTFEFGKNLIHKQGILTQINLISSDKSNQFSSKFKQSVQNDKETGQGIFYRNIKTADIFQSMADIANIYGFSGIEPNTVLLGWPKAATVNHFNLIKQFQQLDLNILFLNSDTQIDFGSRKKIDLWWRGSNSNSSLALKIINFLQMSQDWNHAYIRILIIVDDSSVINRANVNMNQILKETRLQGEVKIINNSIEKREIVDIIKHESNRTDLTIIGMPETKYYQNAEKFFNDTNLILQNLRTTLIIHASSFFNPFFTGIEDQTGLDDSQKLLETAQSPVIEYTKNNLINHILKDKDHLLWDQIKNYSDQIYTNLNQDYNSLVKSLNTVIQQQFELMNSKIMRLDPLRQYRLITKIQNEFFFKFDQFLQKYQNHTLLTIENQMNENLIDIINLCQNYIKFSREIQFIELNQDDLKIKNNELIKTKILKILYQIKSKLPHNQLRKKISIHSVDEIKLKHIIPEILLNFLHHCEKILFSNFSDLLKLQNQLWDSFSQIELLVHRNQLTLEKYDKLRQDIQIKMDQLQENIQNNKTSSENLILKQFQIYYNSVYQCFDLFQWKDNLKNNFKSTIKKPSQNLIKQFPQTLNRKLLYYINFNLLDLYLINFKNRLEDIILMLNREIDHFIENQIIKTYEEYMSILQNNLKENETKLPDTLNFNFIQKIDSTFANQIENFIQNIRKAIVVLVNEIDVLDQESFQKIDQLSIDDFKTLTINLRNLIQNLTDLKFISPIEDYTNQINTQVKNSINETIDSIRLISYNINTFENESLDNDLPIDISIPEIISDSIHRIENEKNKLTDMIQQKNEYINQITQQFFERVNPYLLSQGKDELNKYINVNDKLTHSIDFKQTINNFSDKFKTNLLHLFYGQSKNKFYSSDQTQQNQTNSTNQLYLWVDQIIPSIKILNQIPAFYQHLFIGKQLLQKDEENLLLQNKAKEIDSAINRYYEKENGAFLVLGEFNSGKTLLSYLIAKNYTQAKQIFQINPPEGGAIEIKQFEQHLQKSFGLKASINNIFSSLAPKSCVIFNNIELWWERSSEGSQVIHLIMHLVRQYSKRTLFILNTNTFSYKIINQLNNIDHLFINRFHTPQYEMEEIKSTLLNRHRSSDFKIFLDGNIENKISDFKLSKFFYLLTHYSEGNIGIALRSWLSHIEKIEKNTLYLRYPETPKLDILDILDPQIHTLLTQFILHQEIIVDQLSRIFGESSNEYSEYLKYLEQTGIVQKIAQNTYRINPYLYPFIRKKLILLGLL